MGKISPDASYFPIVLQKATNAGWQAVSGAGSAPPGAFTLHRYEGTGGSFSYRIVTPAGFGIARTQVDLPRVTVAPLTWQDDDALVQPVVDAVNVWRTTRELPALADGSTTDPLPTEANVVAASRVWADDQFDFNWPNVPKGTHVGVRLRDGADYLQAPSVKNADDFRLKDPTAHSIACFARQVVSLPQFTIVGCDIY